MLFRGVGALARGVGQLRLRGLGAGVRFASSYKRAKPKAEMLASDAGARVSRHPSGADVRFDPTRHMYFCHNTRLQSVTGMLRGGLVNEDGELLPAVTHPFDSKGVAEKVAKLQNKTPEQVLAEWAAVTTFGTKFHDWISTQLGDEPVPSTDRFTEEELLGEREQRYQQAWREYMDVLKEYGYSAVEGGVEMIVASPELGIAGTIDALVECPKGNELHDRPHYLLLDWKTNTKPLRNQRPFPTEPQVLNWPFEDLPAIKLSEYTLQTNVYRRLLEREGYLRDKRFDVLMAIVQFVQRPSGDVDVDAIRIEHLDDAKIDTFCAASRRQWEQAHGAKVSPRKRPFS